MQLYLTCSWILMIFSFLFFSSMYIVISLKEVCKVLAVMVKFLNGNDET